MKKYVNPTVLTLALLVVPTAGSASRFEKHLGWDRTLIRFDVAGNATTIVHDEAPVSEEGLPLNGNPFIIEGFIYPAGTLDATNGVNADGTPEFPDLVIGKWICKGYFIGGGALLTGGAFVVSTQIYDFDSTEPGRETLVSEGFELSDFGQTVRRAVTGGTGRYRKARGEARQTLLGLNQSLGTNLRFSIRVSRY